MFNVRSLIGWGVSALLIFWLASALDWTAVQAHLKDIALPVFIPLTLVLAVQCLARAWRWAYLLPEGRRVRFIELFDAMMIGNFATNVLPLRAGEFLRPWMLSRNTTYSFALAFASVVIERFFDLVAVLILFAWMVNVVPGAPDWAFVGAWILSGLAGGIAAFILLGAFWAEKIESLVSFCVKPLPEKLRAIIENLATNVLAGAQVLRSGRAVLMILIGTALLWGSTVYYFWLALDLFAIEGSWNHGLALTVIIALAVAAPSGPGFIGVFQVACVAALTLFHVDRDSAGAYSLIVFAHNYLLTTAYGLFILNRRGLSFAGLRRAQQG